MLIMKDEWVKICVPNFFLVSQSHDNASSNAIYKMTLEFESLSISEHFGISQTDIYPYV